MFSFLPSAVLEVKSLLPHLPTIQLPNQAVSRHLNEVRNRPWNHLPNQAVSHHQNQVVNHHRRHLGVRRERKIRRAGRERKRRRSERVDNQWRQVKEVSDDPGKNDTGGYYVYRKQLGRNSNCAGDCSLFVGRHGRWGTRETFNELKYDALINRRIEEEYMYKKRWQIIKREDLVLGSAMGGADKSKLKKAVRKLRVFLHPDRLPREFDAQQNLLCKMLWDLSNDAWEVYETEGGFGWGS